VCVPMVRLSDFVVCMCMVFISSSADQRDDLQAIAGR